MALAPGIEIVSGELEATCASIEQADAPPSTRYADFGVGRPTLERTADEGWIMADPFPMGRPALRAFTGLVGAICPPDPAPRSDELDARVVEQVRVYMRYMPWLVAWMLKMAMRALDHAPRLLFASRRRLSRLDPVNARIIIGRLANSRIGPIRELIAAVRGVVLSTYFDQEEVHEALDYAPIPWMKDRMALRDRLLAGREHDTADVIPVYPGLDP